MELVASAQPPAQWDDLVESDARAGFFQSRVWIEAITAAYPRYTMSYLSLKTGNRLMAALPVATASRFGLREHVSLPFGTYGGPLLQADAPGDAAAQLVKGFSAMASGPMVFRFELSVPDPTPDLEQAVRTEFGQRASMYDSYLVPLDRGFDWIWNTGFHKEVRTCVRQAGRKGVTVSDETGSQAVDDLHRLHAAQAEGWGVRPHDRQALHTVVTRLGDAARVWVGRREGRAVTACLALYGDGRDVIPWVSGADDEARRTKAYYALMSHIMEDGAARGFPSWNWGGSAERGSVAFFKQRMAGEPYRVLRVFHEAAWRRRLRR